MIATFFAMIKPARIMLTPEGREVCDAMCHGAADEGLPVTGWIGPT